MAAYDRFPHLTGTTSFPDLSTVDVYKYKNEFDYRRWGVDTVITLVNVPWCGDYDNVVKFEDDAARDAYLDGLAGESQRLTTMIHIKPGQQTKLPWPISVVSLYNYLIVDLPRPTSDEEPIFGADQERVSRYLYFIDDAAEAAASTTACALRLDYWSTYINRMRFDYVMLERGHAPMAAVTADEYLGDPMRNSGLLQAPDYDAGAGARIVRDTEARVFNTGETWCVFAMRARPGGEWGSLDDLTAATPGTSWQTEQGVSAPIAFGIDVDDARAFMTAVDESIPQLKQCIEGVFYVPKNLVTSTDSVTLLGYELHLLGAGEHTGQLIDLTDRELYGYPARYANIAKLYTFPYARVMLTSTDGQTTEVRIEDTHGTLRIRASVSLIFPWINIDGHVLGIGGADEDLTFVNGDMTRSYTYGGLFAETFRRWNVPVYAVSQSGARDTAWSGLYTREQARIAAENANASALASNATANANAKASNNTAYTNASNTASNITANNAVSVAANTALADRAQQYATLGVNLSNATNSDNTQEDNAMTLAQLEATNAALGVAATNNNAQAAVSVASYVASGISDVLTLDGAGAVNNFVSAITSATGWSAANQSNAVSQSNAQSIAAATIAANQGKLTHNTVFSSTATSNQNAQLEADTSTKNSAQTSIASNNASLTRTNAGNTRDTGNANADRTKSTADANAARALDTAMNAISNSLKQDALRAPIVHGAMANGETAATRPIGIFARIVTETDAAIAEAGDTFLRYGYALNRQWEMAEWQVMRYFTYWKCSEVWCSGTGNAIEGAQQAIKDIMVNGVTVWGDPDKIGKVGIYDNLR